MYFTNQLIKKNLRKNRLSSIFLFFLLLTTSNLIFGQKKPDFTGQWLLDKKGSILPKEAKDIKSLIKVVKQTDAGIEIKTTFRFNNESSSNVVLKQKDLFPNDLVENYSFTKNLTSEKSDSSQTNSLIKTAQLEEKNLVIITNLTLDFPTKSANYQLAAVWTLSKNGKILTITETLDESVIGNKNDKKKWTFKKIE